MISRLERQLLCVIRSVRGPHQYQDALRWFLGLRDTNLNFSKAVSSCYVTRFDIDSSELWPLISDLFVFTGEAMNSGIKRPSSAEKKKSPSRLNICCCPVSAFHTGKSKITGSIFIHLLAKPLLSLSFSIRRSSYQRKTRFGGMWEQAENAAKYFTRAWIICCLLAWQWKHVEGFQMKD